MSSKIIFEDLGTIDYKEAWEYQERLHNHILEMKMAGKSVHKSNKILFCEHPHVYTLGKNGQESNLLISSEFLKSIHASYYKINRGGDITYHGPGQLVGYPILDLEQFQLGVKTYIFNLEESIILTLNDFGIKSSRLKGSTGVWLDEDIPRKSRKICAIGVRVSKFITMHGFALNINTNLEYFNYINPCGITNRGITSMEKEMGKKIDSKEVKQKLKEYLIQLISENQENVSI